VEGAIPSTFIVVFYIFGWSKQTKPKLSAWVAVAPLVSRAAHLPRLRVPHHPVERPTCHRRSAAAPTELRGQAPAPNAAPPRLTASTTRNERSLKKRRGLGFRRGGRQGSHQARVARGQEGEGRDPAPRSRLRRPPWWGCRHFGVVVYFVQVDPVTCNKRLVQPLSDPNKYMIK
jgi:hypothetical protein